jgi:hypothetical protein
MTKREEQELADATHRIVARWRTLSVGERTERLQAAGILDAAGELAPRYRAPSTDGARSAGMAPK